MVATAMNATLFDDPPSQSEHQQILEIDPGIQHQERPQQQQLQQLQQLQQIQHQQLQQHQQRRQPQHQLLKDVNVTTKFYPTRKEDATTSRHPVPAPLPSQLDGALEDISDDDLSTVCDGESLNNLSLKSTVVSRSYFVNPSLRGKRRAFSSRHRSLPSRHCRVEGGGLPQFDGAFDDTPSLAPRPQRQVTLTGRPMSRDASSSSHSTAVKRSKKSKRGGSTSTTRSSRNITIGSRNQTIPGVGLTSTSATVDAFNLEPSAIRTSMMQTPLIHLAACNLPPSRGAVERRFRDDHQVERKVAESLTSKHARLETCTCVPTLVREANR